jgi:hypothetical protein
MEDKEIRLHSTIISTASHKQAVEVYQKAVQFYDFPSIRTIHDAMGNKCLSLVNIKHKLAKKGEPDQLSKILGYMIASTAKSFNIVRNISADQIPEIIEVIEGEFFFLKLSEVYFVLKQGRMGRNGKMYESLDLATIIGWFDQYVEQRITISEEKSMQHHDNTTHHERGRKYDGFINKLHMEQHKVENDKVKNLAYTMAKKMITSQQKPTIIQVEGTTVKEEPKKLKKK